MLAWTESILARASRYPGASVVVNDRADIALLAGAGGVHVGQDDLSPAAVRTVVGEALIVGLSTHTASQIAEAVHQPISYLAVGPIFGTATKATGFEPVGLELVRAAARLAAPQCLSVVGIGGITLDTAGDVIAAGAHAVAVITDLLSTGDPASRVRAYVQRLSS